MAVQASLACRHLRLRNFRNFQALELELPAEGVALIGDNGAGKTNLLEALYYLEIFRSFRDAPDEQLVRFGADAFFVRGVFERPEGGRPLEVEAGFDRRTRRKRVAIDGVEAGRLGEALGRVGVVVFSPSDVLLVAGAPGQRRRFLDIVLSLNRAAYLDALQRYRHVLRQRNALLRRGLRQDELGPWDEALVEAGARIIHDRAAWVAERRDSFRRRYDGIAAGREARLEYRPAVELSSPCPDEAEARRAFAGALERVAPRERERRITLAGPHRDDLACVADRDGRAVDLRDFGSGGQQRTAAIALRMIEADTARDTRGREPIILLDDVFAELDPGRSIRILELLEQEERGQVILTAPKASDVEPRGGRLPHWRIAAGTVSA